MNPIIISFKELRQAVGWLGITLPFVLAIGLLTLTGCGIQDSISQYFYTRMGNYLTGTLCAVGLFLFAYKGYPGENDGKWCNFAAVCAFGVAFIPMQLNKEQVSCPECIEYFTANHYWWRALHFVSAGLFFGTLAYMSLCKFVKTDKGFVAKGTKKHTRNLWYKFFGITIFSCIGVLGIYHLVQCLFVPELKISRLTFVMETIMLISFGASWLIKGEGIKYLNDHIPNQTT